MRKKSPWEVRDPWPRTIQGWVYLLRANTTCRLGIHCRPKRRIHKYDGGLLPQLCCYCRLIVKYGP